MTQRSLSATRTVRAALLTKLGAPLMVEEVQLAPPQAGEVRVRMAAVGVCHSDLSVLDQTLPSRYPIVLGHEGSGVVVEVGSGVDDLAVGDRVALSWLAQCGECFYCLRDEPALCDVAAKGMNSSGLPDGTTRFSKDGTDVYHMLGLGAFSEEVVVSARAAHKIPEGVPFAQAALIGCGVLTGFGAAVNTARIRRGDSVVVVGCGGVGLNAIQGSKVAGAATIIAVDPSPSRLEIAKRLGATLGISAAEDAVSQIRAVTEGRGADVAIEAAGREESVQLAVRATRPGGQTVLVGAAAPAVRVSVPVFGGLVATEKSIRGSLYGSSLVSRDIRRIIKHYQKGEVMLDELVSATFEFDNINKAFDYCAEGRGARAVITF